MRAYYLLSNNPEARLLMTDIVETLKPLQDNVTSDDPIPLVVAAQLADTHSIRWVVGMFGWSLVGGGCRTRNPSCSPNLQDPLPVGLDSQGQNTIL